MKHWTRKALSVIVSLIALLSGAASTAQEPPAPPHLLLGLSDFVRLNELARTQLWAAEQRQKIIHDADAFPESYEKTFGLKSVELPPEGAQWMHYYACPDTGSVLKFRPPNHNICPDTGQEYPGYPYDQVVYQLRADALHEGALTSALAYRLTGDRKDALKAALILKLYADKYSSYPIHDNHGKQSQFGARVYAQTLDEAIFLINMAWTYDLLRDTDVFTPTDRIHIEKDLLYAAAKVTGRAEGPTLNITSWIACAVGAVGYTLNDRTLIDQAIDGPLGFRFQMKEYVIDGFWAEGALGYQFYALTPLEYLAQMATRAGVNLWQQEPNLQALFVSPIELMFPDGSTPPFNDAKVGHLYDRAYLYEMAYSALHNPLFAAVAEHSKRKSREAFLFGVASIERATLPQQKSAVFPNAGLAVLRAPQGDMMEILKFGPQGGVHGHFDKLNEVIYARGGLMSVDPGTQKYGLPIHFTWDRMTVAHNTISIDETEQVPATGKLVSWQTEPRFTAVTADAGPAYANADLQRTSIMTSDYILEISTGTSKDGKAHDFDWNYHNYGVQHIDASLSPYSGFPQHSGYEILTDNQAGQIDGDLHTRFTESSGRTMDVWVQGDKVSSQIFTGVGPSEVLSVKVPYVIVRRRGVAAKFVAVLEPGPATSGITSIINQDGEIHIYSPRWEDIITIGDKIGYIRRNIP